MSGCEYGVVSVGVGISLGPNRIRVRVRVRVRVRLGCIFPYSIALYHAILFCAIYCHNGQFVCISICCLFVFLSVCLSPTLLSHHLS